MLSARIRRMLGRRGAGGRLLVEVSATFVCASADTRLASATRRQPHFIRKFPREILFMTDRQCGALKSSSLLEISNGSQKVRLANPRTGGKCPSKITLQINFRGATCP